MYEELYCPLPDKGRYLERLQIDAPKKADLEQLNSLIYANQCRIPFENLDIFELKKPISLGIEDIFHKVIVKKRGGYCFELNALFLSLLKECGFDAYSCKCRILRRKNFIPPSLHQGILVKLDGKLWFCDVGYGGPMPAGALLVEDSFKAAYCGQTFRIACADSYWWTVSYASGEETEKIIQFTTMPQEPVEFLAPNEYCSKNENSVFLNTCFVNRRTEHGSLSITNDKFTEINNRKRKERKIQSPEELNLILKTCFGIELPITVHLQIS